MRTLLMLAAIAVLIASALCGCGDQPRETAGPNGIADHETARGVHEGWRRYDHDAAFRDGTADSGDPFLAIETR